MLESTLFSSLFPHTAKRQSAAETIFDVNADIPLGHDLPENGGITGNMPYDDVDIATPDERVNVEQIDTPNIVDDRVSTEQGGATTQPFVPTQQELTPDTSGISSLGKMPWMATDQPEFALPYSVDDINADTDPYSRRNKQIQNALAQGQYDAQNPRNRDKGFKGALKEALQNFAFGLSHAQPGMGFWESMALGGTGLGMGIADRSANERRDAMRKLPMLQQNAKIASDEMDAAATRKLRDAQYNEILRRPEKEEADRQGRIDLATKRINLNADIRSGIAKPFIDEDGKVWRQYLNADSTGKIRPNEPVVGPDGQQEYVPGEQGIEWFNPRTKTKEIIKARQGAAADATIASGDATREQGAAQTNAAKAFEAQKENVNNWMQFQNNITTQLSAALGADAGIIAGNGAVQGVNAQIQAKNAELQALIADETIDADDRAKRINSLTDDLTKLNGQMLEEIGKTEGGIRKKAEIQNIIKGMKPPGKVTYTPFKAVTIGKPVSPAKDPLGLFK